MAQITAEQLLQVVASLVTNTDLKQIDFERLGLQDAVIRNGVEAGCQFTAFLKNRCRLIVGEPKIIPIDRRASFDPETFIGKGWKIEEEDERSLALAEIDLSKIQLVSMLQSGETSETLVRGEEKQRRLKAWGYIRLDAKVFQTFWENHELIPAHWKEQTNGHTTRIFFDGTTLRHPRGSRCVLYLYFRKGEWFWDYVWLSRVWDVGDPSAVLASQF